MGLDGAEEADRAGLGAAQGAFSALNGSEAAFELGRWDVVERVVDDILAERASDTAIRGAHEQQAVLAAVRGDFEAAHESRRAVRERHSRGATPEMTAHVLELEAELATWEGRPDDAAVRPRRSAPWCRTSSSRSSRAAPRPASEPRPIEPWAARVRPRRAAVRAAQRRAQRFRDIARAHGRGDHRGAVGDDRRPTRPSRGQS